MVMFASRNFFSLISQPSFAEDVLHTDRSRIPGPVALIGAATAFSLLGDQMLYAVLPTYYTEMGLMPYQVGLVLSFNRWIRLATNHLAARMCLRHSVTLLASLAFGLGALLTFAYGMLTHFGLLLIARLLWGLCWSFIRQIGMTTVVDAAPEGRMGRTMGFYSGLSRTGAVGGNFVGAVGHDLLGFSATMVVFGFLSLLGVPLARLSRRELPQRPSTAPQEQGIDAASRGLIACGFIVGCAGPGLMMSMLGMILKETVGSSLSVAGFTVGVATLTGLLLALRWVSDLAGAPLLGHLSDSLGRRGSASAYFAVGGLAMAVGTTTSGLVALIVVVLAFFLCAVGVTVVLMAEAGSQGPKAVASYVTAADVGSAIGPIIGWSAAQAVMSTDAIFWIVAGLYGGGMWIALHTVRERAKR